MSFSTEIARPRSERYVLARVMPARYVGADLSFVSGTTYQLTIAYPIASLKRNGTALTKVTTLSANDQWTYDETTSLLQVRLASAPSATTNIVIAYFYLFFSSKAGGAAATEDPLDSLTSMRSWEPRIVGDPSFSLSVSDAQFGVFSIQPGELSLADHDIAVRDCVTEWTSFSQARVDVWFVVNDVVSTGFRANVSGLKCEGDLVSLELTDAFSLLRQPAFLGDTADEAFFKLTANSFPSMYPQHDGRVCPFVIGPYSRYRIKGWESLPYLSRLDEANVSEAACTNYVADGTTSTNRVWGLCRTSSDGIRTPAWNGTLSNVSALVLGSTTVKINYPIADIPNIDVHVGDPVSVTMASGANPGTVHGVVTRAAVLAGTPTLYTIEAYLSVASTVQVSPPSAVGVTITPRVAVSLLIVDSDGNWFLPAHTRDYTVTQQTTSAGNKFVYITFTNNFEANHSGIGTLNPATHKVYWRVRPATNGGKSAHGEVLRELCESAGIECDTSTFSAADAAFTANVLMQVPSVGQTEYGSYLTYAEMIARSSVGYLTLSMDGQAEYHLLAEPDSPTSITADEWIQGSLSMEVDYGDLRTGLLAFNSNDYENEDAAASTAEASNALATYLHGVRYIERFEHCLDSMGSRLDVLMALRAAPAIRYSYQTPTSALSAEVGDDVTVTSAQLLGGTGAEDVKVVSYRKSMDRVALTAAVIRGLP